MHSPNIYILQNNQADYSETEMYTEQIKQEFYSDQVFIADTQPNVTRLMDVFIKSEIADFSEVNSFFDETILIDVWIRCRVLYQTDKNTSTLHAISGSFLHKVPFKKLDMRNMTVISHIDACSILDFSHRSVTLFTTLTMIPLFKKENLESVNSCLQKEATHAKCLPHCEKQSYFNKDALYSSAEFDDPKIELDQENSYLQNARVEIRKKELNEPLIKNGYTKNRKNYDASRKRSMQNIFHSPNNVEDVKLFSQLYSPIKKSTHKNGITEKADSKKNKVNENRKASTIRLSFSDLKSLNLK